MKIIADNPAEGIPVAADEPRKPHWWDVRGHLHRAHDTLAKPDPAAAVLISGKHIRFRFVQSTVWTLVVGVIIFPSFIAGLYWLGLEQDSSAKLWWDHGMGFIHSGNWGDYRHSIRNYIEPAAGALGAKTLLAKAKYWAIRVGLLRLIATPFIVLALAIVLAVGGTWLIDFGLPGAWAHVATLLGHRGFTLDSSFSTLGSLSVSHIVLGIGIGLVLHPIWAPAGATLQGELLDRAVSKAKYNRRRIPGWVKRPEAPPVIRERFSAIWRSGKTIYKGGRSRRWVITVIVTVFALVTIVGIIAHYWVGAGHSFPLMT